MDLKLLAWGLRRRADPLPRLWLFTDPRLADPVGSVAALPRGRAGVVFRHDGDPARAALGRALLRVCRDRRLPLVVAGDTRLAATLRAGVHLRAGRWPSSVRIPGLRSSSAHSRQELIRACRAGASVVFLSPAFPTVSHPGGRSLGPLRWSAMAQPGATTAWVAALGGVDGTLVRRLAPRRCRAAGAIGALATAR